MAKIRELIPDKWCLLSAYYPKGQELNRSRDRHIFLMEAEGGLESLHTMESLTHPVFPTDFQNATVTAALYFNNDLFLLFEKYLTVGVSKTM